MAVTIACLATSSALLRRRSLYLPCALSMACSRDNEASTIGRRFKAGALRLHAACLRRSPAVSRCLNKITLAAPVYQAKNSRWARRVGVYPRVSRPSRRTIRLSATTDSISAEGAWEHAVPFCPKPRAAAFAFSSLARLDISCLRALLFPTCFFLSMVHHVLYFCCRGLLPQHLLHGPRVLFCHSLSLAFSA